MSSFKRYNQKLEQNNKTKNNIQNNINIQRDLAVYNISKLDKVFYKKAYLYGNDVSEMAINTHYLNKGIINNFLTSELEFYKKYPDFDLAKFKGHLIINLKQEFPFDEQYYSYYHYAINVGNVQVFDYNVPIKNDTISINKRNSDTYSKDILEDFSEDFSEDLSEDLSEPIKREPSPKQKPSPLPPQIEEPVKVIQSLWIGTELSLIEQLCIRSFLNRGYDFHLYTYNTLKNVPEGTTIKDGTKILPKSDIFLYNKNAVQDGGSEGSPSGFSNLFRYKLLYELGGVWVDMDLICINPFNFNTLSHKYVFSSEQNFKTGETKINVGLIKCPPKSLIMKYCYYVSNATNKSTIKWGQIGPQLFQDAVKKFNLTKYVLPWWDICPIGYDSVDRIFNSNGSKLQDFERTSHAIHLWGEFIRRSKIDPDNLQPNSLYLQLISRNFKLTGFTCVTEPLKTGYPIIENVKSCLSILDSYTVIYGRDEPKSRKMLEDIGATCIVTNKWQEDWIYSDMTYHMDLGLKTSQGDLSFKIDSDYIMSLNDQTRDEFRMRIFQYLPYHFRIYVPKINYLPYNFYLTMQNSIYCINKYLLNKHNIKYEIAVDKDHYVNRLFIRTSKENEEAHTIVTNDPKLAIYNYDCSEMTKEQYIYKQRGWFNAFYKMGGDISRFGLTPEILANDDKLYKHIKKRSNSRIMWALKKEQLYYKNLEYNPLVIRSKIDSLSVDQYGHSHFCDKDLLKKLENYLFIYKKQIVHLGE